MSTLPYIAPVVTGHKPTVDVKVPEFGKKDGSPSLLLSGWECVVRSMGEGVCRKLICSPQAPANK